MVNLKDLNIILTGATGGIGGAILEKLKNLDANIIATGTNQEKLDKINSKFENVIVKKFDISEHSLIDSFIDECNETFNNKIDVLINSINCFLQNLFSSLSDETLCSDANEDITPL